MSDLEDGGLFCIAVSDSEDDSQANKKPRDGQTEEEFQAVRKSYQPKIENGEIWKISEGVLPLQAVATKAEAQELLHAVEELYFFRRFSEGATLARRILDSSAEKLDNEHRNFFVLYEERCLKRMRQRDNGVMAPTSAAS
ncbi:hypothetical protein SODALDRAFT_328859 [Sodiomyces alkalinus F11]|uniref:Uncharacterized protein n=1 Tax=Sodiomyces alkalinus (strain CBS 110278 / VKM F-3762 / F11) TaxID=1314773 RepID=A0A3N2PM60_SODAK|nr:hypothetical protein SODALDRAFT_328859 [Sodiomyces alkalinus F11]ROT35494.1 hypothetical protein SODALDRAFT_328859 [Sodiomyces alkalinus F11]